MVKILLIIPYMDVEQQVYRQLQEMSLKDIEIETIHIFGTDQSVIKQKEPDIIVARGMTCSALRSSFPNIHMVEISMTSFDILAAVAEAKHCYSPKKIALCVGCLGRHDADNFQIMGGFEVLTFDLANESDVDYAIQVCISAIQCARTAPQKDMATSINVLGSPTARTIHHSCWNFCAC